jgi:hypothetical protein
VSEKIEPVDTEPLVAPPVLKPVPVHDVALVEPHVSVDALPELTLVGEAESDAVVGAAGTVIVLD